MANAAQPVVGVRVGVKNGGCAGMTYTMEYADAVEPADEVVEDKGVRVLIDPKAVLFLLGTEMDYKTDKLAAQFVFNNPNQTSACGCGESVAAQARRRGAPLTPACGTRRCRPTTSVELFAAFGPVMVRRMFGGAGIFADGTMFALVHDGVIYLKADERNAPDFRARGPWAVHLHAQRRLRRCRPIAACRIGSTTIPPSLRSGRATRWPRHRGRRASAAQPALEHDPEKACPGLDPGWIPVFGKDHAPTIS